jgi:hypothetical protein
MWYRTAERLARWWYFSITSRICRTLANAAWLYNRSMAVAARGAGRCRIFRGYRLLRLQELPLLRRFLDGTPPYDHLGDIFAALDAEQFQRCFVAWVASLIGVPRGVVAIDGKTVRRSGKTVGEGAIHMVSAFAANQRLVLGQVKVAENPTRSRRSQSCSTCWWSRAR